MVGCLDEKPIVSLNRPGRSLSRFFSETCGGIGPDFMKPEHIEELSMALFEMGTKDRANLHSMDIDKIRRHLNADVKKKESPIRRFTLGELMVARAATNSKPSAAYKEFKLMPNGEAANSIR